MKDAQPWSMGLVWEAVMKHWCTVCTRSAEMTTMTPSSLTVTIILLLVLHNDWLKAPQTFCFALFFQYHNSISLEKDLGLFGSGFSFPNVVCFLYSTMSYSIEWAHYSRSGFCSYEVLWITQPSPWFFHNVGLQVNECEESQLPNFCIIDVNWWLCHSE